MPHDRDGDAVPRDERALLAAELLAEATGRALARADAEALLGDERLLNWLAEEARARAERGGRTARASDAVLVRRGEAMMARALGARLRVRHAGPLPRAGGPTAVPVIELGVAAGVGRELWDEPVDAWVELPAEMPAGDYVALRIVGESMAPLMHTGDTVLVRVGGEVQRDTVVVARHPDDGYVCKRVTSVGRDALELASLAPGRPPIRVPHAPGAVLGTVLLVWGRREA